MSELLIKQVNYSEAKSEINSIRKKVFQEEQGVAEELEFDGLDGVSIQVLAYISAASLRVVGTARIRDLGNRTVKIERLAVLPEVRGQGIGKKIMETTLDIAVTNNYQTAVIHAQNYIKQLYQQLGFQQIGDVFEEAGISHVKMIKTLV